MKRKGGFRAQHLGLAVFAGALAKTVPAYAANDFAEEAFQYLREFRPTHLLAIAFFFLVVAIFAKFRQASGFVVLMAFFGSALALAAFFVFWLTAGLMRQHNPQHAIDVASAKEAEPDLKSAPPRVAVPVGGTCKRDRDCGSGTICVRVGGAHQCWAPCGAHDACAAGFACMTEGKQRVCLH